MKDYRIEHLLFLAIFRFFHFRIKNNLPTMTTKTRTSKDVPLVRDDTPWDERLDYLRDNRLSPLVEVIVAWIVALLCLLYYAYSYVSILFTQKREKQDFFPLMTSPKGVQETRSTAEIFQGIVKGKLGLPEGSTLSSLSDDELVNLIRQDDELRRQVSALFQQEDVASVVSDLERWKRLWPKLLRLPDLDPSNDHIALVLPAYREDGRRLARTLRIAMEHCQDPSRVQVIVVDAGQCPNMNLVHDFVGTLKNQTSRVVEYKDGGGRGPTLDYGCRFVAANIGLITFLHSDTLLPKNWDASVHRTWFGKHAARRQKKLQAVAFAFGQDKSPEGLDGRTYPWGIEAVQMLGNIRAYVASLPYGDHVISMPLAYYRHVGGFPHQPIMEDYEIMDYWRRRARHVSDETMTILPSMVRTGVRRWQAHGVVYVTLVNALIVYRYQRGWTPTDVFRYYYQRPNKKD